MDISKIKNELLSQKESKFKGNIYHYSQVNFSYNSNKIEGSRLTSDQTEAIFDTSSFVPKGDDLIKLDPVLATNVFERPVIKISIYKNRRGRYKGIYLWAKADLGTCRIEPIFATTYNYELIPIDDIKITLEEPESAF